MLIISPLSFADTRQRSHSWISHSPSGDIRLTKLTKFTKFTKFTKLIKLIKLTKCTKRIRFIKE